jgi:hypothetical protein
MTTMTAATVMCTAAQLKPWSGVGAYPRTHGNQEKLRPSQATPEILALSRAPVLIWLRAGPVACLASPPQPRR